MGGTSSQGGDQTFNMADRGSYACIYGGKLMLTPTIINQPTIDYSAICHCKMDRLLKTEIIPGFHPVHDMGRGSPENQDTFFLNVKIYNSNKNHRWSNLHLCHQSQDMRRLSSTLPSCSAANTGCHLGHGKATLPPGFGYFSGGF